jgi:putative ABC transport system permease protein
MPLEHWPHDVRLAGRSLLRARAFTGTAVLTMALGIGGTTVMFALIEGVLLRPMPVREQERLIVAWKESPSGGFAHWPFQVGEIEVIGRESRLFERVGGVSYSGALPGVVVENGSASYISSATVTGTFFATLGVRPIRGRGLERADDVAGAEKVLVITHGLWQRRYGGARDVIGRRLMLGDQPFTIVGVMPPDFVYPRGVEAWMTVEALAPLLPNPTFRAAVRRENDLVARLRPGVTRAQALRELEALVPRLEADARFDMPRGLRPVLRSYEDIVVGDTRPAMAVLFAAVSLVLLIASANVANLLLLRSEGRRSELAVRAALGATRARMAGQLLAESLLLAITAGLVGLASSGWVLQGIVALVPGGLPRVDSVRIDAGVVLFTVAVAFASAALAALAPAFYATRTDLAAQLRTGRQPDIGGARHGRRALIVAQVALAVTIVAAASLLTRSLLRLQTVDTGLAADRLFLVSLSLPPAKEDDLAPRRLQFLDDVMAGLAGAPGIERATPVNAAPFAGAGWDAEAYTAEGQSPEQARTNPSLNFEAVHPSHFATLGVPVVRGRAFADTDRVGAPEVAIVTEDVAARIWPGEDPIGKRLKLGGADAKDPWRMVVGVVKATRYRELAVARATLYLPAPQFIVSAEALAVRTALPPAALADVARARVRAVDPRVRVMSVVPFRQLLEVPLARPRFNAFVIVIFALASFLLAAIGLYAVMAAYVRQRRTEIGIRLALGATPSVVRRLVLGEGVRLAGVGAALGLVLAFAATRVLRGLLFAVDPLDPVSLLGAAVLLVGASGLACYLPARYATGVDPARVLRTS